METVPRLSGAPGVPAGLVGSREVPPGTAGSVRLCPEHRHLGITREIRRQEVKDAQLPIYLHFVSAGAGCCGLWLIEKASAAAGSEFLGLDRVYLPGTG